MCNANTQEGIQRIGDTERQYSKRSNICTDGLTCIGYSEIDKYAIKIYERHFPGHHNFGDITAIHANALPDFDLLVGGFPCQSFSIAGKRAGFSDTRGNLFFEIARILKEKQPRRFLLENVKGLLSHDSGNTFKIIIYTLTELGYDIQWQVLNSKNFGVPQNRERVFIVGHLRGTPRPEVFPIGVGNEVNPKQDAQRDDVAHTLQCGDKHRGSYVVEDSARHIALNPETGYNGLYANAKKNRPNKILPSMSEVDSTTSLQQRRVDEHSSFQEDEVLQSDMYEKSIQGDMENNDPQLVISTQESKADIHKIGYLRNMPDKKENRDTPQKRGLERQHSPKFTGNLQRMPHKTTSEKEWMGEQNKECERTLRIRRLTPIETARLQGFPDDWHNVEGISDTQAYKVYGNAVTVNVVREIMKKLL